MRTTAQMIDDKGRVVCEVEIEGGTIRSAVQAVVGRLIHTADINADAHWEMIEVKVYRWENGGSSST